MLDVLTFRNTQGGPFKRRGDRNDEGISLPGTIRDRKVAGFQSGLDQSAQTRLVNMDIAILDSMYHLTVDIHSDDLDPMGSEGTCGWKANVTKTEDADFFEFQGKLLLAVSC